jgi:hypothetical protein
MAEKLRTVSAIMKATTAESQTTLRGTSFLLTRCHTCENGIALSLEKAYPILELLAMHMAPAKKMPTATIATQTSPPTPLPYLLSNVMYRA